MGISERVKDHALGITEKVKDHALGISEKVKENLAYSKELLESGIEGASEARKAVLASEEHSGLVTAAAQESWLPAAVGVLAGAVCGVLADDRKPVRGVIAGGLLGAVLGFGGSFAWKTRPLTSAMAREAGKHIGGVRDERWLARNPVNYG